MTKKKKNPLECNVVLKSVRCVDAQLFASMNTITIYKCASYKYVSFVHSSQEAKKLLMQQQTPTKFHFLKSFCASERNGSSSCFLAKWFVAHQLRLRQNLFNCALKRVIINASWPKDFPFS